METQISKATPDVKALDDYKKYFDEIRKIEGDILKKEAEISKIKISLETVKDPTEKTNLSNRLGNLRENRKKARQRQLDFIQKAIDFKNKASKYIGISPDEFEDYFEEVYGVEESFIDSEETFLDTVDAMEEFASDISFDFEAQPNPNTKKIISKLLANEREIVVGMNKVARINNHVDNVMKDMAKAKSRQNNSLKALQETLDKLQLNRNAVQANINDRIAKEDIIMSDLVALKKVAFDGQSYFEEFMDTNVNSTSGYADNIYGTTDSFLRNPFKKKTPKTQTQIDAEAAEDLRQRQSKFDLSMESKRNKEDKKRGIVLAKQKDEIEQARLDKANERSLSQRALNEKPSLMDTIVSPKSETVVVESKDNKAATDKTIMGMPQNTVIIGGVALLVVVIVAIVLVSKK